MNSITSRTHPHVSAHSGLTDMSLVSWKWEWDKFRDSLIVCCAPLSTNALIGCPFTSTGMLHGHSTSGLFHKNIAVYPLKHDDLSETLR